MKQIEELEALGLPEKLEFRDELTNLWKPGNKIGGLKVEYLETFGDEYKVLFSYSGKKEEALEEFYNKMEEEIDIEDFIIDGEILEEVPGKILVSFDKKQ